MLVLAAGGLLSAQTVPADRLIDMAKKNDPGLEKALMDTFGQVPPPGRGGAQLPAPIVAGTAGVGVGPEFIFAVAGDKEPMIKIDAEEPKKARKVGSVWVYQGQLKTGAVHKFAWIIDGKPFGGRLNIAAYGPDSYPKPGVQKGKMVGPIVHTSKLYPEMKSNYWYYIPAGLDVTKPSPVMIWQDGQGQINPETGGRFPTVLDNLIAEKRVPMMAAVFVQPGTVTQPTGQPRAMRSIEYDTVSDLYARFLLEEILPEVDKNVKLRTDGYSRAIAGESSGAIAAFTAAWYKNDDFTRVLSRIGSFTSIQWKPGELDGGNIYPFRIRKDPKKNIRVWLQDGTEDLENNFGSWPLQNMQMANSLKMKDYDYHFVLGNGDHSGAQGAAQLPEELVWLWRGYDPAKTSEVFTPDPAEKAKPYWRIVTVNRD